MSVFPLQCRVGFYSFVLDVHGICAAAHQQQGKKESRISLALEHSDMISIAGCVCRRRSRPVPRPAPPQAESKRDNPTSKQTWQKRKRKRHRLSQQSRDTSSLSTHLHKSCGYRIVPVSGCTSLQGTHVQSFDQLVLKARVRAEHSCSPSYCYTSTYIEHGQ